MGVNIADIKQELPILDACRRYLPGLVLKRRGRGRFWACCPLHGPEKTPSFMVDVQKGRWHCFGCGKYGDGLDLVSAALGVPLAEAVKIVAADLGISRDMDPGARRAARERITKGRQEREAVTAFGAAVERAYREAAATYRAANRIIASIKAEADLDRPEVAAAMHAAPAIESILDGLETNDAETRYIALVRWRKAQ